MELGGNEAWKTFWEEKEGKNWADVGLEERYSGDTGEEWKERLSAQVEGREFTGMPEKKKVESRAAAPSGFGGISPARTASPAASLGGRSRKEANESFFAKKGSENASRPADLPPSKGGKYAGFGSEPPPAAGGAQNGGALPGVDEFQKDPVAALTKGFGWFTTTVGKGAKTVNDGWIQPTAQKVCWFHSPYCQIVLLGAIHRYNDSGYFNLKMVTDGELQIAEADLATQARLTAAQVAQKVQTGTKGAAEQFNKFVEDSGGAGGAKGASRSTKEPERKDFWDSFGAPAGEEQGSVNKLNVGSKPSAIGTAAMKSGVKDKTGDDDKWEDF